MIHPGATLGMLGGGQLGRMFVHAATAMGYRIIVLDPNTVSPAGEIAHLHLQANYDDAHALKALAQECAVITTEFENVPAEVLAHLAENCTVCPNANAVEIAQNRIREKKYVSALGIDVTPFHSVKSNEDITKAFSELNAPFILKTASFGYDGKGQVVVHTLEEAVEAWRGLNNVDSVLEEKINLATEVSAVIARSTSKELSFFPVAENTHVNGILHTSTVPAKVDTKLQEQAKSFAQKIADSLNYFGVLAVEFFVDKSGRLFFNEMAPRTHNSGHYTIDACYTSQFEQQVRAICGLPLGSSNAHSAVTMVNLLGDLWGANQPEWSTILSNNRVKLHLYGKKEARSGRKMGHFSYLAPIGTETLSVAQELFSNL